jgi:hypothetical protein
MVVAGQAQTIRWGTAPSGTGPNLPPPPPPPHSTEPPPPPKKGVFAMAMASIAKPFPNTWPTGFIASPNSGGSGGLRVGYRVNNPAAFDLMFQYVNVFTPFQNLTPSTGMTFSSVRVGAELRLMTSGKTVRFVGSGGGGFAFDHVSFDDGLTKLCKVCFGSFAGTDFFVTAEMGIEFDFSNVLLDAVGEASFQSTRGLDATSFGNDPIPWLGGGVRVGYALW